MHESETTRRPSDPVAGKRQGQGNAALAVYVLYLLELVFGITGIIGLIVAYVFHGDGPGWLQSHYRFQIRTFWIGLLYGIISVLLMFVLIGYLLAVLCVIWHIIRCVKGLNHWSRGEAHPNPASWLFG